MNNRKLIEKLNNQHRLAHDEWVSLITSCDENDRDFAAKLARENTIAVFGKRIYFRGIIEFTNICKNDCLYCGIRRSNSSVHRYRLSEEEILSCCDDGYRFGYRTFVLQGGEDPYWDDGRLSALIKRIKTKYPDCAVTLSIGERSRESYQALYDAGADRFLLRHETATPSHYQKLHPEEMKLENRLQCLKNLKEIGYQTGAGFMVGSPYQTADCIASDLEFLCDFKPQMVGIGPFIPHRDTPLRDFSAGSAGLTVFLLSLVRLALPNVLLPATTALGTVEGKGRQRGVLAGCNVVMPNLTPMSVRKDYLLYDNKVGTDSDAKDGLDLLRSQMEEIGYEVVTGRGDSPDKTTE